jgi:hypothetical protein
MIAPQTEGRVLENGAGGGLNFGYLNQSKVSTVLGWIIPGEAGNLTVSIVWG